MYAPPLWIADQARNDEACPCRPVVALPSCVSLWIPAYAGMTVRDVGNNVCSTPPLWIADQARNDEACPCRPVLLMLLDAHRRVN